MLSHLMHFLVETSTASAITSEMASVHSGESSSPLSLFEAEPTVSDSIKRKQKLARGRYYFLYTYYCFARSKYFLKKGILS